MVTTIVTGAVLDQIIVDLGKDGLATSFGADHVHFFSERQKHPVSASFTHSTYGLDLRILLAAGEQPFTLADALRPALTECLAGAAHLMRGTHQVLN